MEYSPTVFAMPPRVMGMLHSLTLMCATSEGSRRIAASAHASPHPQSHAMSRCAPEDIVIPACTSAFTSAITASGARLEHCGQFAPLPWLQQFVRFSDAVIVKNPARLGAFSQMSATELAMYCWTAGVLVHSAACSFSTAPFSSEFFSKKARGMARGSFR